MYGFLIPCSGGQSIALRKSRLLFGRSKNADAAAPPDEKTAFCRLELVEGWWHIEDLNCPQGLKVNGCACKRVRLNPDDEIAIGKHRYRIAFDSPRYPLGRRRDGVAESQPATLGGHRRPTGDQTPGVLGRLIPLGGGQDIAIFKPRVTIGRRMPCDVVLKHSTVSSRHCVLELSDGYWRVEDLDSHNGIRVDGVQCQLSWVLPGSRLSIAEHQYELSYVGQGPPPPPYVVEAGPRKSLMAKLGVSERDLDRAMRQESVRDEEDWGRRRWDLLEDGS